MSKKWTVLIILAVVFTAGYAARGPIVSSFFQWYLKGYCRECLDSRLSYESLRHENGKWVLDSPVLITQNRLENGGYRCQAELATIEVSISWWEHSLNLDVAVESPHIDIGKGAEDFKRISDQSDRTFRLFNVHTSFSVPEGTIFLHDFAADHLVPVPLFFSIDLACKKTREGCASIWLAGHSKESQDFLATYSQNDPKQSELVLDFHDVDCSSLQQVLRGLWPESAPMEISEGTLSGKLLFTFPQSAGYHAEGQVTIRDLSIYHTNVDCQTNIPNLTLHLTPKEVVINDQTVVQTIGYLDVPTSSTVVVLKNGEPFWKVDALSGSVSFQTGDYAKFTLEGTIASKEKQRKMQVGGRGRFADQGQTSFTVDVNLKGQESDDEVNFHFSARQLGDHWSFGEVELSGFGSEELSLMQHLTGSHYPQWQQLQILRGNVDAAAVVYLKGLHLSEVKVERIAAHNLEFDFPPWGLSGSVDDALGSLSFDLFAQDPLKTLNVDLNVRQGKLNFEGLDRARWEFAGIHSRLSVRNGVVQKSLLKGMMAGLNGEIILDGTSLGPLALFNFTGLVGDLSPVVPESIRAGLEKNFNDEKLKISAEAIKINDGLLFKGKLIVQPENNAQHEIAFGFSLEKSSRGLWRRWPPHPLVAEYCPGAGFEALHILSPALAAPVNIVYRHLIKQQLGFSGFGIKAGWFHADDLPLDKFLSPFLFSKGQMQLSGIGNFRADFDEQKLVVHYDARDMVLDNTDFAIEIQRISGGASAEPQLIATYVYDFESQQGFNTFPIYNGTYFEKNSGLLFTEINAKLSMENDLAHFADLSCFCNGLFFEGTIDLDWSMPGDGVFEVGIHTRQVDGKISQLQHFLSHINKDIFFLKIPLEGNVALQKNGANLRFSFFKEGYDFKSHVVGAMTDGKLSGQNIDMTLQELSMNFDYKHEANTLEFTDIQGTLLVGKPNHVEEYFVAGDRIRFTDYDNNEADFDLWVGDKHRDIIRLAGKTVSNQHVDGSGLINFDFDYTLSHFGDVHPNVFEVALKDDWSQVEVFRLEFDFELNKLLSNMQKFSRTGLLFLSRNLLKELNGITNAQGDFKTVITYDGQRSIVNYDLSASDVSVGTHRFNKVLLTGTKKGSLWSVEQMQFDDISMAFDVLKEGSIWNISFLGARFGEALLIGLEGQYLEDDAHLDAQVNLLEANLADLSQWPSLQNSIGGTLLAGEVRTSGTLHADFDKTMPHGMRLDIKMNGSLQNARFKGFSLQNIQDMSFHYNSNSGFSLYNVGTGLKSADDEIQAGLFLENASFDFSKRELNIQGLHFNVPVENTAWVSQHLHENLADMFTQNHVDIIKSLKDEGTLQGILALSLCERNCGWRLALNDGIYKFMGTPHNVRNFVVESTPDFFRVNTEYLHQRHRFKLEANSATPTFDVFEVVLSDISGIRSNSGQMPLIIHCIKDYETGYCIQKMTGSLCGMTFDLIRNPATAFSKDAFYLSGNVAIDLRKAAALMNDNVAEGIKNWEIGSGYTLRGQWVINKEATRPLDENLSFQGDLIGKEFEFLGYRLYDLYAQVQYHPQVVYMRNAVINDGCGNMQIGEIDFFRQGEIWQTSIPLIALREFKPSLLRSMKASSPGVAKALVIRQMSITDLRGILGDRNSFTGDGQLSFINPPKKNVQHTLFAIPVELLTRIGLDMAALTPVRGNILYKIRDGKAAITRFKDMYSKGKLSKFYLPNNGYDSYVDFDGNVHLQVRMKQYNIIFKLAELFTVNVQGTLKKPTYTLNKQQTQESRPAKDVAQTR